MSSTTQQSNQSPSSALSETMKSEQASLQPPTPEPSKPEQAPPESKSLEGDRGQLGQLPLKTNTLPNPPKPGQLSGSTSNPLGSSNPNPSQATVGQSPTAQPEVTQVEVTQKTDRQPNADQAKATQVKAAQDKAAQAKAAQVKATPTKAAPTKATQAKAAQAKATQAKATPTKTAPIDERKPDLAPSQQTPAQAVPPKPIKPVVKLLHSPLLRPRLRSKWWGFAGAIAIVSLWIISLHIVLTQLGLPAPTPVQTAHSGFLQSPQLLALAKPEVTPKPLPAQFPPTPDELTPQPPGYGHFLYGEISPDQLMIVGSYSQAIEERFERLSEAAGLALLRMIDAARQDGVWLVPISGFRDFARQEMLFQIQIEQVGSAVAAARSVAPAGYSEHHTGYAVDLADGLARAMDLSLAFGNTPAFEWLTRHAVEFGFELSFPENNTQGVMYEPWHWRFVGSPAATQTFAQARNQEQSRHSADCSFAFEVNCDVNR
ncbi:MAG: D-alanyl-D-alanine carboxypeptidase family protein [Oculatellaceae cyanobacterium bins.114]|nr:D-alanyl-D-alanine carboxypeptidase family protein [Oculatellaceae cyanobacterium bins.114]